MSDQITTCIICENPPDLEATAFGLQDKKRELVAGELLDDGRLRFRCELTVSQADSGQPNFTGSFAHGTVQERFLYLTHRALQQNEWQIRKRIKVHLKTITWEQVETALTTPGAVLIAAVDGRGAASVPLLGDGWTVQSG